MANIRQIVRRLAGTEAAEIAEVAVVLPLVFMLLLGIVWFGRAFNIYSTITQAAQQGAITAARESCATCGAPGLPNATTVDTAVTSVLKASSLDITQIKQWEANNPTPGVQACPAPAPQSNLCTLTANKVWVCSSVLLNSATEPTPQCGAMVSFQFPFKFYLPFTSLNMQQITMSAQGQSRMEN
jgi:Flp pilus assembly protein TadG